MGFAAACILPLEDWPDSLVVDAERGIGRHLGNPVSQNTRGHLLGHVRDVGLVAATNFRARASQSTERQLFHTDGCDVVGLMCLATAKSGGMSSLVSSITHTS